MSAELVEEWVRKAEADWTALERLQSGGLAEVADAIAFHAQQCAEKYLKALMQHDGNEPPRTHHLGVLLDLLIDARPRVEKLRAACESLTPYAVQFRYLGQEASEEDAAAALEKAEIIRTAIRNELG